MGTSVGMIEPHYGALIDTAHESLILDAARGVWGTRGARAGGQWKAETRMLASGACRDRTGDLRLAKPALSQLS